MEKLEFEKLTDSRFKKMKLPEMRSIRGGETSWSTTACSRTWLGMDNDDKEVRDTATHIGNEQR